MTRTLALLPLLLACAPKAPLTPADRSFTILAVNDVYRITGLVEADLGGMARLRTLRAALQADDADLLVLHGGDVLSPSLESRFFGGEQMVDAMNRLDGDATAMDERMFVVFGNHEFDKSDLEDAAALDARVEQSQFHWLGTNIDFALGEDGAPLVDGPNLIAETIVDAGGVRVGIFGVTIGDKIPAYVTGIADPAETARAHSASLRAAVADVVVAVTHLAMANDEALLKDLGAEGPDFIIGGHDHNKQQALIDGRPVYKADADALTATVLRVTVGADGALSFDHRYATLDANTPADADVAANVAEWEVKTDTAMCVDQLALPAGCLSDVVGHTQTVLDAEELKIRRYESSLGDWIADQMVASFADQGAQIAFINSGSLRLNQDLPAGTDITRRHIEELFAYPAPMRLIKIDGATLKKVTERAIVEWTGSGQWLQVSGFAWVHDPEAETTSQLTLLGPDGARPIADDEQLLAVAPDFLLNPKFGQDGYTFLSPDMIVAEGGDLKQVVVERLGAAGEAGIAPVVEGRICNTTVEGPCLAVTP